MEDLTWWQQAGAMVFFLTVVGWASSMHREAKRSADALEQIATQLDMDRRSSPEPYR